MASIRPDITLIRGDSASINFELAGGSGPTDLTGSTIFFTAKPELTNDAGDTSGVITVEVTDHSDPENGKTIIPLLPEDTDVTPGTYWYDIQVIKDDGTIVSIPARKLIVTADVTRRTS